MKRAEAIELLTFLAGLDPRNFPTDDDRLDVVAEAWHLAVVDGIPGPEARALAAQHYAVSAEPFTPSALNAAWGAVEVARGSVRLSQAGPLDAHCGRVQCPCTHSAGCYKGWIDAEVQPAAAVPCRQCRPWLRERLGQIPPAGQRNAGDQAWLRGDGVDRSTVA